jgi:hypothetical protein
MADRPALVRNAADTDQVKRARRMERRREERRRYAMKAVLATSDGRAVIADIFDQAGIYSSVYDQSGSMMYFKEGRRNFGLELRAFCESVDEEQVERLDQERRARLRADDREVQAAHTAAAGEGEHDG